MKDFKREFSSSKDSCKRREINNESRKKSQVDVFVAVILSLRAVFSLNHFVVFVAFVLVVLVFVVLVFVVVAFSLSSVIVGLGFEQNLMLDPRVGFRSDWTNIRLMFNPRTLDRRVCQDCSRLAYYSKVSHIRKRLN
jgi:hypothetical protein